VAKGRLCAQVEQEGEVAKVGGGDGDRAAVWVYQQDQESRNALVLEGSLSQRYFQVREEVYQHCRLVPQ
jgi:hypothetical protein